MESKPNPPIDPASPEVACLLQTQDVDPKSLKLAQDSIPLPSGLQKFNARTLDGKPADAFISPLPLDGVEVSVNQNGKSTSITQDALEIEYHDWITQTSISDFPTGTLVSPNAPPALKAMRDRLQALPCGKPIA